MVESEADSEAQGELVAVWRRTVPEGERWDLGNRATYGSNTLTVHQAGCGWLRQRERERKIAITVTLMEFDSAEEVAEWWATGDIPFRSVKWCRSCGTVPVHRGSRKTGTLKRPARCSCGWASEAQEYAGRPIYRDKDERLAEHLRESAATATPALERP